MEFFAEMPVVWANYISVALFLALGVIVWTIPKSAVVPAKYAGRTWRDLRWWATGLIIFQIVLYAYFS